MEPVPSRSQIPEKKDSHVERFLVMLPELSDLGIFSERFILELRRRKRAERYMVDCRRKSARPLHPEDSLKHTISMTRSRFRKLVGDRDTRHWEEALKSGAIEVFYPDTGE